MTTLREYVAREFPNHEIDLWDAASAPDLELSNHTVVSQVVGTRDGLDLLNVFRRRAPNARVAALAVRPAAATVVPDAHEDRDGAIDLPARRIVSAVVVGAVVAGVVLTTVMVMTNRSTATAAIVGGFGVLIGAAAGAIIGGSRLASQRANFQPHAPGRTITVVAAFLDDDASATLLAGSVGPVADYDVRIVDQRGGWRSPDAGGDSAS